jgi:uncharacterized membrane protein
MGQRFTESMARRVLCLSVGIYVFLFFSSCCLKYYGFKYDDFDLAQHDQLVWNLLHGRIFSSILGIDFLGNHVHFIAFLVAPFYWLVPHPLFLLFLQTVFLASGAFPLYALARRRLDYQTAFVISLCYLLYPGVGYTNLFEFHPTCFATFFLLCAAYYFYKEEFVGFNVFMFLSLICQENIPLIFVMWGIYAFFLKRPLKWSLWPMILGLVYFLFCVEFILPSFNKNIFDFFRIYAPLGHTLAQVLHTCFRHPVVVLQHMFTPYKLHYLVRLFEGEFFIPFLSPLSLLPAFLVFLQHLLSNRLSETNLHYHYTAELIPFIFIAFMFGVEKITRWVPSFKYWGGFLLLSGALVAHGILGPNFHLIKDWKDMASDYTIVQKEKLVDQIPKDAPVTATFAFLPHLSHHQDLYSFHYVFSGFYTLSRVPFHLPGNIQYALIDFDDYLTFYSFFYARDHYRHIDDFLKRGWGTVDVQDSMVLLKRGVQDKYPLFNFIGPGQIPSHPLNLIVDNRLELFGYDISRQEDRISLVFYWKPLKIEPKDLNMSVYFLDQKGQNIGKQYRPICYRIWPTQAWTLGQLMQDHEYITVSPQLKRHLAGLGFSFFDVHTGKTVPLSFLFTINFKS